MEICTNCLLEKDLSEFPIKRKNKLDTRCKMCMNHIKSERRKQKKIFIKSLMPDKCQQCGYDDERCLNNWMGKGRAKNLLSCKDETIITEIKNSLVICCNCVSIKLYKENLIQNKDRKFSKRKATIQLRERRIKTQKYIDEIKNQGCIKCNLKNEDHPCIFHFDHIEKKNKVNSVGRLSKDSLKRVIEEIKFCQILCANCHKIKTLEENDSLTKIEKIRKIKDNRKKITDEMILEIKKLLSKGIPKTQIAKKLNISRESIYNILKK